MSNSKDESVSYEVKFVIPKGKNSSEVNEIMKTAFEAMECNCLEPMWINQEECLQFKEKQSKLFICDPFGDEAFQHLSSLKCRILGPLCILSCLQNGQSLPLRPYPVYSVTMRGITLTCSNIDKTAREEIAEKTQLMGGLFNKDLTQSVTHLIVDSVGSTKYHVANRIGLPVMLPDWISECWNNGQYQQLHASDSSYNCYRCPIFKGLCITVSQLSNEERKTVQQAIEQNGGRYSGQMRANVTTHLVLIQPKGDKYKFGKNWKIKCVKLSWLYESLEAGYSKEETQYQLGKVCNSGLDASTPEKSSSIHKSRGLGDCSTISNISIIPCRESRIDETTNSDITIIPAITSAAGFASFCPLDELSVISNGGQFLDGCRIFITGFSGTRLDKLRKIINAGCGTRFNKMGENITHIILGEKNEDIFKCASECSTKPHIVSYLWLLNCYKERKLLDEEPYLYNMCSQIDTSKTHSISEIKKLSTLQISQENENNKDVPSNCNNGINRCISIDDNMNADNIPPPDIVVAPHTASKPQNTLQEGGTSNEGNLLFGLTFIINGFGPKDTDLIEQMVKSENGKVVIGSVADFCIVPVTGNSIIVAPNTNIVTNCWLQMCIEQEVLLPFDSNPFFKPLSIKPGSVILKDCVLSFSQYMGTERDCLTHLAEEMGAHCQEYFVRKASKSRKLLPNTHLVVATPEGNKYEAAKKWSIPAVTKDWLFASVYKGEKANEEEYLVDIQVSMTKDCASASIQIANVTNLSENNDVSNKETSTIKIGMPTNNESNLCINGATNKSIIDIRSQADVTRSGSEPTPSKFLNPNISFHPDYEVNSLLTMLDNSNNAGGHSRKVSLPMQDLFALNISKALKNIGVEQNTSDDAGYQEHASSDLPKNNPKENIKPLKHVVVCISKKLVGKQSEFNNIITSLGGECQWNYSSSCTHFVCQGKSGATSREIKLAQDEGKKIISPEWIYACQDAFAHVDEMLYPFTYNPRLSLLGQISSKKVNSVVPPEKLNDKGCIIVDQLLSKASNSDSKCQLQIVENKTEKKKGKIKKGIITKELEDLLNVSKVRAEKTLTTSPNSKASALSFEGKFDAPHDTKKNFKPDEPSGKIPTALPEAETQSVPIAWDDPTGRSERERLADHVVHEAINIELNACKNVASPEKQVKCAEYPLDRNVQVMPPSDFHNESKVTDDAADLHELETEKSNIEDIYKFMFSGLSDNEKDHYSSVIKSLGGKVSSTKSFDGKATHLILGQPLKNEKFLGSVASGLWVLHKTYVEACKKAGRFVDESCHEWGGPMTYRLENALPDKLSKVAMCPSRWRATIQNRRKNSGNIKCGAFQGWKVFIIAEKQKLATYSRILENGGAEIISLPFNHHTTGITHAFIEVKSQRELNKINLESLVSSGISCLKPEYLAFYLIEPIIPSEEKFIIPEAQELIDKFSTEKKRKCSEEGIGVAKRHHQCSR